MSNVLAVACGIFRAELEALRPDLGLAPLYLDSMLHMRPDMLQIRIDTVLETHPPVPTLFIYGDCTPRIVELSRRPGFAKTSGINCCEIMLGREQYRRLRRAGAFFFLPEWTLRWREVFERELGFAGTRGAGDMLREVHTHLLYLDTRVQPVPDMVLAEIGRELGLPMSVLPVGLDYLRGSVLDALGRLHAG